MYQWYRKKGDLHHRPFELVRRGQVSTEASPMMDKSTGEVRIYLAGHQLLRGSSVLGPILWSLCLA